MANTMYNVFNLRFFSIHLKLREKLRDSQKAKEGKPRTIHSNKKPTHLCTSRALANDLLNMIMGCSSIRHILFN